MACLFSSASPPPPTAAAASTSQQMSCGPAAAAATKKKWNKMECGGRAETVDFIVERRWLLVFNLYDWDSESPAPPP